MYALLLRKTTKKLLKVSFQRRRIVCQPKRKPRKAPLVIVHLQKRLISGTPMFCMQCEQTSGAVGCTVEGICGKNAPTSNMQDLLLYVNNGVGQYVTELGEDKLDPPLKARLRHNTLESTFATLTNVNFSEDAIYEYIQTATGLRDEIRDVFRQSNPEPQPFETAENSPASYQLASREDTVEDAKNLASLASRELVMDSSCFGLRECAQYGLKGLAAYYEHAESLRKANAVPDDVYSEQERDEVYAEIYSAMNAITKLDQPLEYYLGVGLQIGAANIKVMGLMDRGHNMLLGAPEPTSVSGTPIPGKCLLVSGHDILDLYLLLQDIDEAGLDINVYTHGEILPAHGYPEIKKFKQLKGNFGDAWQYQREEFIDFPGPIVMTTNCMSPPTNKYIDRVYTTHAVGADGVVHLDINDKSARAVILQRALELPGLEQSDIDKKRWMRRSDLLVGFGHQTILQHAGTVIDAIQAGALNHIFVIGGCDGSEDQRNYFTEIAALTPPDSLILGIGCGKLRMRDLDLGTLGDSGIPRMLDLGQCNDAYSAVVVATKLAEALGCTVHDLPLHFAVSWFEQKSVTIFLSLLHLGIQNVRIGPALPAFLTPDVLQFLGDNFGVRQINAEDEEADMRAFLSEVPVAAVPDPDLVAEVAEPEPQAQPEPEPEQKSFFQRLSGLFGR